MTREEIAEQFERAINRGELWPDDIGFVERLIRSERESCAEIARKVRAGTTNEWIIQASTDIEALILARSPKE